MIKPKVSVLIPSYNYAKYLPEAIDSVLNQTFQDFEIIVVDNCSEDDTSKIVNDYIKKDTRIKLIVNEINVGMYRNYNEALLHANGEYIKFLNADDKFHATLLEKFVNVLDTNPTVSLVSSKRQYFGDKNDIAIVGYTCSGIQNGKETIPKVIRYGNFIGEPTTVMFRKFDINIGMFNPEFKMVADLDMWIKLLEVGDFFMIDEVLSYFRIHSEQGTNYLNNDQRTGTLIYLQMYILFINKLLFSNYIDKSQKRMLLKRSFLRVTSKVAKNINYVKEFFIFYNPLIFLLFHFSRLLNPLRLLYNKLFKDDR